MGSPQSFPAISRCRYVSSSSSFSGVDANTDDNSVAVDVIGAEDVVVDVLTTGAGASAAQADNSVYVYSC